MAVYTEVAFDEAAVLLRGLGLGELKDLQGIRSGIENTNYYALSTRGQWVVTLFERLTQAQLPYYLELMRHLAQRGIPVPAPQPDAAGRLLHTLAGKPAAVVTRLPGSHRLAPEVAHARQVGAMLGRMHAAGLDFPGSQPHLRGLDWWVRTTPEAAALPRGPIHADLFRDNVMFDETAGEDRLCGFFDFYFAGTDALLFDVAVCLNDWCIDHASGRLVEELANPFLEAYRQARPLAPTEPALLPAMLRAAAFRFWLSRLWDWHLPRAAAMLQPKDPAHFERVLRDRIAHPWQPQA
jgi:homoserine kinase type II